MKKLFILALAGTLLFTASASAAAAAAAAAKKADPSGELKVEVVKAKEIVAQTKTLGSELDKLIAALKTAKEATVSSEKRIASLELELRDKTTSHEALEKQKDDLSAEVANLKGQLDVIKTALAESLGKISTTLATR